MKKKKKKREQKNWLRAYLPWEMDLDFSQFEQVKKFSVRECHSVNAVYDVEYTVKNQRSEVSRSLVKAIPCI